MSNSTTPFSFHCMICFEEFHAEDIYPVVLPCGHTYVCNVCAERLDKCMECRTPLYTTIPRGPSQGTPRGPNSPPGARSQWSSARSGGHNPRTSGEFSPPQPPIKKRLPLPKNVVLLSLMEATELATQDVQKKYSGSPSNKDSNDMSQQALQSMGSMVDAEEVEEEKIKEGTSLALSVAGTYAVAHREGLDIFPSRPTTLVLEESGSLNDEDVDALVRFFHLDNKADNESVNSKTATSPGGADYNDPARLGFGDRVQVVSVEGGWAKLARGYGYVRADRNQLVKVGGSVDRACKLEAMLLALSNRRKELRTEQSKVDNKFIRLMSDLQASLQNDEDLTVITADTFSPPMETIDDDSTIVEKEDEEAPEERNDVDIQKPVALTRQLTPPNTGIRFGCFANGVFDSFDGNDGERQGILASLSQQTVISPRSEEAQRREGSSTVAPRIFPSVSHPSPSEMRAGARAWRELHGRPAEKGINFRTGMSGHMGLLSTHSRPHEYLEGEETSGAPSETPTTDTGMSSRASAGLAPVNFRMSSHSGLTMSKSRGGFMSALRMPSFGAPSTPTNDGGVSQAGSM